MAETINLYQAKTTLSHLVERAAAGEEIIIAKNGRPLARLVPFSARATARVPGLLKGQIRIADDFDAPLPDDIARAFQRSAKILSDGAAPPHRGSIAARA